MSDLESAIELFRLGRLAEAEDLCARLTDGPEHQSALMLLVDIRLSAGRHADALPCLEALRILRPRDAANARRLGGALLALNRSAEAVTILTAALALEPGNLRAHNNLGQALMQLKAPLEALAHFEQAVNLNPGYAIGLNNMGLALNALGRPEQALAAFRKAVAVDETLGTAWFNLAAQLAATQEETEALVAYDRVVTLSPSHAEAWSCRAALLADLARVAEAVQSVDHALQLRPELPEYLAQRASFLLQLERYPESLHSADAALSLKPDYIEALNIKAGALSKLHQPRRALEAIETALALAPQYLEGLCTRALVHVALGDHESAARSYAQALAIDPDCVAARAGMVAVSIPAVPVNDSADALSRGRLESQVRDFAQWLKQRERSPRDLFKLAAQQLFYASYQQSSNLEVLATYRNCIAARLPRFDVSARAAPQRRFHLGIVSAQVFDHSVFVALTRGWLKHLDRDRFELTLFSLGRRQDGLTIAAGQLVDRVEAGHSGIKAWSELIAARNLSAILYPEVGMDPTTLGLAHLRLAPLQMASWGHPETTGLATMDCFVSAQAFEPIDARRHYAELLAMLPNLGVAYEPEADPKLGFDPGSSGIDPQLPTFICAGAPFKYRPMDDDLLVRVAERVGPCNFVFFEHERRELSQRLRARLARRFIERGMDPERYLRQIPWLPRAQFLGLLRSADVYLDTVGFSGFNTQMLALQAHLPSVAFEGAFMRGRLSSGILRHIGLAELVAPEPDHYVEIAARLALEPRHREAVRTRLAEVEVRAYDDTSTVRELERLLLQGRVPPLERLVEPNHAD